MSEPHPFPDQDDSREAYKMTIAHVIYNRGLGHSLETCESLAEEILQAVEAFDLVGTQP